MNEIQVFDNLRVKEENGQIFFDAESAAIGLGISRIASSGNISVRWERVNKYLTVPTSGHELKRGDFITEPQLYKLAIRANSAQAEKFQDWVTSEVLPAIRQHGSYMTNEKAEALINRPNDTLADLLIQAGEQLKAKDVQISEMKPKALFADAVDASENSILVGQLAKLLRQNGIDIGQNRLFNWLRDHEYLGVRGEQRNLPTQKSMDLEITETKRRTVNNPDGSIRITTTPKITGKGQIYFVNKFLQEKGSGAYAG
ncbi:phage antirepressor KilAC domain-containing protein [Leuconostoc lactis]|uniref:phage antirepressor KilAC domain-containing protein n=1 Tax=Leuconostoc lactis TaxID=1246 RepID=UPI0011BB07C3|nr:phage antirepressor KilAC domain-containing protein [Leuconostoc lactis]QEA51404.1 phage antirepressor Ant [Leuconostoc lactis]